MRVHFLPKASLSAGSLLPRAATDVRSAHSREGPQPARAVIRRPQQEKRPPRKLADAAELCDAAEESGGERLFDHLRRVTLSLLCRAPFRAAPTQDVRAGRGAKRSAAQALQDEAGPSAGQPQRASQRGVRSAAAALSQRAIETEISKGRYHYFGACSMGLSAVTRCRPIAFVARQAHPYISYCAGLDKLFQETHDGNAAFQALREYRNCKKAPAALIAVSALDISGWNSMTKREVGPFAACAPCCYLYL